MAVPVKVYKVKLLVPLTVELRQELRSYAEAKGVSMAEVIRELIIKLLSGKEE